MACSRDFLQRIMMSTESCCLSGRFILVAVKLKAADGTHVLVKGPDERADMNTPGISLRKTFKISSTPTPNPPARECHTGTGQVKDSGPTHVNYTWLESVTMP